MLEKALSLNCCSSLGLSLARGSTLNLVTHWEDLPHCFLSLPFPILTLFSSLPPHRPYLVDFRLIDWFYILVRLFSVCFKHPSAADWTLPMNSVTLLFEYYTCFCHCLCWSFFELPKTLLHDMLLETDMRSSLCVQLKSTSFSNYSLLINFHYQLFLTHLPPFQHLVII